MKYKYQLLGAIAIALITKFPVSGYAAKHFPSNHSPYLRADLGYAIPGKLKNYEFYNNKKPNEAWVYGVGAGYIINNNFRGDLTLTRMQDFKFSKNINDAEGDVYSIQQKFSNTLLMLNGYFDIKKYNNFVPYVTIGLGTSYNEVGDYRETKSGYYTKSGTRASFAWDIGAGVSYHLSRNVVLDLNYKYYDLGKIQTSSIGSADHLCFTPAIKAHFSTQVINFGVRYNF